MRKGSKMSENQENQKAPQTQTKSVNVNFLRIGLLPLLFASCFATGNCETCGYDRDYVGDLIDMQGEEE